MALEKWNMNFCLEHSIRKYRTIFLMFRRSWKFSAGMVQKVMFYLLSNWISLKRFVKYGKQIIHIPLFYPTLKVKALACKSGTIFKMQSNLL